MTIPKFLERKRCTQAQFDELTSRAREFNATHRANAPRGDSLNMRDGYPSHWFDDASFVAFLSKRQAQAVTPDAATPRHTRAPKLSREGLISISTIAAELKIIPRVARHALRGSKTPKPVGVGWAWPQAEVAGIKERIQAWLASLSSTPRVKLEQSKKSSSKTRPAASAPVQTIAGRHSKTQIKKKKSTALSAKRASKTSRGTKR